MSGPKILLVVGGGIAAYKSCELVRIIRKEGGEVTCVVTEGGQKFVTPMALAALSERPVHTTLWDLKNEVEMGHIQLSRQADLVVVCPATADLLAKMAAGIADDLATTLLLATDKPVMAVPAMNVRMWQHAATVRNVQTLRGAGVDVMEPDEGAMACGEYGPGRLPDPLAIWQRISWALGLAPVEVAPVPGAQGDALAYPGMPRAPEPDDDLGLGGLSGGMIARSLQRAKKAIRMIAPTIMLSTELVIDGSIASLTSSAPPEAARSRTCPRRHETAEVGDGPFGAISLVVPATQVQDGRRDLGVASAELRPVPPGVFGCVREPFEIERRLAPQVR